MVAFEGAAQTVGPSWLSDAESYHDGEYALLSASKSEERYRVLDFIRSIHHKDAQMYALTLPGESWMFELALERAFPTAVFLGLERSRTAFERSVRVMRAKYASAAFGGIQRRWLGYGDSIIEYARTTARTSKRIAVRSHRLLHMDFRTYVSVLATDYGATFDEKKEFHNKFCHRSAVWLDFTGSLTDSLLDGIRHLPFVLCSQRVPVVITVFGGHDKYHNDEERIAAIVGACPSLDFHAKWRYAGKNGAAMLTLCFVQEATP